MKKAELTTGMHVGVGRGRDWANWGVSEGYVLDATHLYVDSYGKKVTFDDPLNPGKTVEILARVSTAGGRVAVLKRRYYGGSVEWAPELVGLALIVGTFEETNKVVEEVKARKAAVRKEEADTKARQAEAFALLLADYPALGSYKVRHEGGRVTLPLDLLREILEGNAS